MIDAPISEDMEYDSDYLDEYHGREAENYLMDFDIELEEASMGYGHYNNNNGSQLQYQ